MNTIELLKAILPKDAQVGEPAEIIGKKAQGMEGATVRVGHQAANLYRSDDGSWNVDLFDVYSFLPDPYSFREYRDAFAFVLDWHRGMTH